MYEWQELKALWEKDQITQEQAIGQLILWGAAHHQQGTNCERRLDTAEGQVKTLLAEVAALRAQVARRG